MKDKTIRYYGDFFEGEQMELTIDEENSLTISMGNFLTEQPSISIRFNKESIKELIEDLQNLIK